VNFGHIDDMLRTRNPPNRKYNYANQESIRQVLVIFLLPVDGIPSVLSWSDIKNDDAYCLTSDYARKAGVNEPD
jgi:hypothetical protein